jgi:hypothetical protein
MRERNPLHIAMGVLGLLGMLLYVLACGSRPAWSPDSSKVLFRYCSPELKETGVALYDRDAGTVRSIFSRQLGEDKCSDGSLSAAWRDDGSSAIIVWGETREKKRKNPSTRKMETIQNPMAHVEVQPMGGESKKLHVKLRHFQLSDAVSMVPLAESRGKLYLIGTDKAKVLQLDLKTGKQKYRSFEDDREEPVLYSHEGHIIFGREAGENSADSEFGELDPTDLSLHRWFVLKNESLKAHAVSDFTGFLAFEPHGNRMVMPASGEDKKPRILMCNGRGLEQVLKPDLPDPAPTLGNLEWSRDDETLYATVISPTEKSGVVQVSLGEISLAGGPARLTSIVRARISSDDAASEFQFSISQDGSAIAASTAHFDEGDIDPVDRGLFLVDLRDPQRKVTRIHYPPMTSGEETARE